jgi:hypothetical protein
MTTRRSGVAGESRQPGVTLHEAASRSSPAIRDPIRTAGGRQRRAHRAGHGARQANHFPLQSTDGLRLHNVSAEPATLQGKKGLRIAISEEASRRRSVEVPLRISEI